MQQFIPVVCLALSLSLQSSRRDAVSAKHADRSGKGRRMAVAVRWPVARRLARLSPGRDARRRLGGEGRNAPHGRQGQGRRAASRRRTFTDFELSWEWRVPPGGNNGVKYLVTEDRPQSPGHEYQMIDDEGYPGKLTPAAVDRRRSTTSCPRRVREGDAGQPANGTSSRIVVRGNRVEHWLNGTNVLTYELGSESGEGRDCEEQVQGPCGLRRQNRRPRQC